MTKMTNDELIAVLRALERKGMVDSCIVDGEVQWRFTAKCNAASKADWQEAIRIGLENANRGSSENDRWG